MSKNLATLANAENNALLNRLGDRLMPLEVETLCEEQAKTNAKAEVDTLAEKVTEWQVNTFGDLFSVVVEADAQRRHSPTGLRR